MVSCSIKIYIINNRQDCTVPKRRRMGGGGGGGGGINKIIQNKRSQFCSSASIGQYYNIISK